MAHNPVNHPLRPIYRAIGGLVGLYYIVFGILGIIRTAGDGFFGRAGDRVLFQGANLFWSIVALLIGAIVLAGTVLGRNRDVLVDTYLGWTLVVIGTLSLMFIRTNANLLDFSVSTVIICFITGLALILAGLYSKVAPPEEAGAPRQEREGRTT